MAITFKQLIDAFIDGENEGFTGTESNKGNLSLKEGKLFHYNTVIAERYADKIIINISRYSLQTGQVQKKLKEAISEDKKIIVKRVPKDYSGSLVDFI